ncbi:MAG: signal peptidase I [Rhodospirillales bacterium]
MGRIWNLIWRNRGDTYRTVIVAVLVALGIRTFLFEPFNIPSGSMKPTLLVGDYLFVSKMSYGYSRHSFPWSFPPFSGRVFGSDPERGDVAVFKTPADNNTDYIKRVIGLPGDRIQVRAGELYINDQLVPREDLGPSPFGRCSAYQGSPRPTAYRETLPGGVSHVIWKCSDSGRANNTRVFTVPPDHFFMMGDNRDNSNDSRGSVGPVPLENFVGRADILFISFDDQSSIFDPSDWGDLIRWGRIGKTIE